MPQAKSANNIPPHRHAVSAAPAPNRRRAKANLLQAKPTSVTCHEGLLREYKYAFRAWTRACRIEEEFSLDVRRGPRAVIGRYHENKEPIFAYSHDGIDEHFDRLVNIGVGVSAEWVRTVRNTAHMDFDSDAADIAQKRKASGYDAVAASVAKTGRQMEAALNRLLKEPPRSLRDVATVALFIASENRNGCLPDRALPMWTRNLSGFAIPPRLAKPSRMARIEPSLPGKKSAHRHKRSKSALASRRGQKT